MAPPRQSQDGREKLTPRQLEVLHLLAKGLTNLEIAGVLNISPATAKIHVSHVLKALSVSNRTEAAGLIQQFLDEAKRPNPSEPHLPALAVLPFHTGPLPADIQHMPSRLVDDLITRLGRCWFPVIAQVSATEAASAHPSLAAIAMRVGARYLVDGTVSVHGQVGHTTVRLVDVSAGPGRVLWAEAYDWPLQDAFERHDEVVCQVIYHITNLIVRLELHELAPVDSADLRGSPYTLALQGEALLERDTCESTEQAKRLFVRAIKGDPTLRFARDGLNRCHRLMIFRQWASSTSEELAAMRRVSDDFLKWYPDDSWAQLGSAFGYAYAGQRDTAIQVLTPAMQSHPSLAAAHRLMAQLKAMGGQGDAGIGHMEKARVLDPSSPNQWVVAAVMALCHFVAERYDDAVEHAKVATGLAPSRSFAYAVLATCQALGGDTAGAQCSLKGVRRSPDGLAWDGLQVLAAGADPEILQRFVSGLKLAGLTF